MNNQNITDKCESSLITLQISSIFPGIPAVKSLIVNFTDLILFNVRNKITLGNSGQRMYGKTAITLTTGIHSFKNLVFISLLNRNNSNYW